MAFSALTVSVHFGIIKIVELKLYEFGVPDHIDIIKITRLLSYGFGGIPAIWSKSKLYSRGLLLGLDRINRNLGFYRGTEKYFPCGYDGKGRIQK